MKTRLFICLTAIILCIVFVSGCTSNGSGIGNSTGPTAVPTNASGFVAIPTAAPVDTRPEAIPPVNLTGTGQQASAMFPLEQGLSIFSLRHNGSSDFTVWLLDDQGRKIELLADTSGRFSGSKAVGVTQAGNYLLNVGADGSWSVDIAQLRSASAQDAPLLLGSSGVAGSGNGQADTPVYDRTVIDGLNQLLFSIQANFDRQNAILNNQVKNEGFADLFLSGYDPATDPASYDQYVLTHPETSKSILKYMYDNDQRMQEIEKKLDYIQAHLSAGSAGTNS